METSALKQNTILIFYLAFILMIIGKPSEMAKFHVRNNCDFKVWPAIVAEVGNKKPLGDGFGLGPAGDSKNLFVPAVWSGRVWGRTDCVYDQAPGILLRCMTGDCGSSTVECTVTTGNVTRESTVATVKLRGSGDEYINIIPQDYLPMAAFKSKEGLYEFHFCPSPPPPPPPPPPGDIGSINNHNNISTTPTRNDEECIRVNPHSDFIVNEFLMGVLSSVVAAALIAFLKYYFFKKTTQPSDQNA